MLGWPIGCSAGAPGVDLAGIAGIGQHPPQRRRVPARVPVGRGDPCPSQGLRHAEQSHPLLEIVGEDLTHHRRFGHRDAHAGRITRSLRIQAVAIRRAGPGQQQTRAQLRLSATPHPLGNDAPLVLRHCPANLQQQLVVRVRTHWPVEELDQASRAPQFLEQEDLMDIVAGETIRRGQDHPIHLTCRHRLAQSVQPRSPQGGAAVAVVAEDVVIEQGPAMFFNRDTQSVELLLDCLRLRLSLR